MKKQGAIAILAALGTLLAAGCGSSSKSVKPSQDDAKSSSASCELSGPGTQLISESMRQSLCDQAHKDLKCSDGRVDIDVVTREKLTGRPLVTWVFKAQGCGMEAIYEHTLTDRPNPFLRRVNLAKQNDGQCQIFNFGGSDSDMIRLYSMVKEKLRCPRSIGQMRGIGLECPDGGLRITIIQGNNAVPPWDMVADGCGQLARLYVDHRFDMFRYRAD